MPEADDLVALRRTLAGSSRHPAAPTWARLDVPILRSRLKQPTIANIDPDTPVERVVWEAQRRCPTPTTS